MRAYIAVIFFLALLLETSLAQQCGSQNFGRLCPGGLCCSQYGYCGSTRPYCGPGCQSQCRGVTATTTVADHENNVTIGNIFTSAAFDEMLKYRNDDRCQSKGFYTYNALITAAQSFDGFGTTGDLDTRKRELAAFLAQTSHQTSGGWQGAPDGPYAWGYCFIRANNPQTYCSSNKWPCPTGRQFYGRGPIQITHNHNYGKGGKGIGADLINDPEMVATDPVVSFKTAIWYWMSPQGNKPSSHEVITEQWKPSDVDKAANRLAGYGVVTNVLSGGVECGHGPDDRVASRIGFYKRYCDLLGVTYGENLDCYSQIPFM